MRQWEKDLLIKNHIAFSSTSKKLYHDAFHDIAFLLLIINNYSQYVISFNVFVFSNLNEWPFINFFMAKILTLEPCLTNLPGIG